MRNTLYLFVIAAIVATFASPTLAQDTGRVIVEKHGNTTTETEFKPRRNDQPKYSDVEGFREREAGRPRGRTTASEQSFAG